MKMQRYADIIRRTIMTGAYLGGVYFSLPFLGHKDFPESHWSRLCLLAPVAICWLVAWLAWLDGVRAAWRREAPGITTQGRDRFIEARALVLLLLILGTVLTLVPGWEQLAHADD